MARHEDLLSQATGIESLEGKVHTFIHSTTKYMREELGVCEVKMIELREIRVHLKSFLATACFAVVVFFY